MCKLACGVEYVFFLFLLGLGLVGWLVVFGFGGCRSRAWQATSTVWERFSGYMESVLGVGGAG